jgi:hypothetical protein
LNPRRSAGDPVAVGGGVLRIAEGMAQAPQIDIEGCPGRGGNGPRGRVRQVPLRRCGRRHWRRRPLLIAITADTYTSITGELETERRMAEAAAAPVPRTGRKPGPSRKQTAAAWCRSPGPPRDDASTVQPGRTAINAASAAKSVAAHPGSQNSCSDVARQNFRTKQHQRSRLRAI